MKENKEENKIDENTSKISKKKSVMLPSSNMNIKTDNDFLESNERSTKRKFKTNHGKRPQSSKSVTEGGNKKKENQNLLKNRLNQ